jgi:hypothetical protein
VRERKAEREERVGWRNGGRKKGEEKRGMVRGAFSQFYHM